MLLYVVVVLVIVDCQKKKEWTRGKNHSDRRGEESIDATRKVVVATVQQRTLVLSRCGRLVGSPREESLLNASTATTGNKVTTMQDHTREERQVFCLKIRVVWPFCCVASWSVRGGPKKNRAVDNGSWHEKHIKST